MRGRSRSAEGAAPSRPARRFDEQTALIAAALAYSVLLIAANIAWLRASNFLLIGDVADHFFKAAQLTRYLQGDLGSPPVFLEEPEYSPLFYIWSGVVMKLTRISPQAVSLGLLPFLLLLGVAAAGIGREVGGLRAAAAAFFLTTSAPLLLDYSRVPFMEIPAIAMVGLALWNALLAERTGLARHLVLWGVAAALAILFRWTTVPVVAAMAGWIAWRRPWRHTAMGVAVLLALALPWFVHAWRHVGAKLLIHSVDDGFHHSINAPQFLPHLFGLLRSNLLDPGDLLHGHAAWLALGQLLCIFSFQTLLVWGWAFNRRWPRGAGLLAVVALVGMLATWPLEAPHVRYFMPMVPALIVLCLAWIDDRRPRHRLLPWLCLGLASFQAVSGLLPLPGDSRLLLRHRVTGKERYYSVAEALTPRPVAGMIPIHLEQSFEEAAGGSMDAFARHEGRYLCILESPDYSEDWVSQMNFRLFNWTRGGRLQIIKIPADASLEKLVWEERCEGFVSIQRSAAPLPRLTAVLGPPGQTRRLKADLSLLLYLEVPAAPRSAPGR